MSHHPADDAPEAGRRRAAHAALERAAAAHWAQAGALLGEADTAYGRIARFSDDEDQAVANDASVEAHAADVQAAERTADAGVLRGPRASVAYTVTVQFEDDAHTTRLAVLQAMRTIGLDILEYVH